MTVPITLNNVVNLTSETTAVTTINNNSTSITAAFGSALDTAGDQMEGNLDMNSNQILNLPAPATNDSPLRLIDLNTFNKGGTIATVPAGGTTGQILSKTSNIDYAMSWVNESTELVAGSNISITGTGISTIATVPSPTFTGVNVSGLTVSQSVQTDSSKNLVSVANTGSGNNVLNTSPTLVTPLLGTPTSGILTNCTGLPVSTGISGLATGIGTFLATPTSANLASALTDETGTGAAVFATSPTLVTPLLGTPTSGTLTNCTGLPVAGISGLGTGVAAALGTAVTGSSSIVLTTSPNITTPNIIGTTAGGNASAGSVGEYISSTVAVGSTVALTTNIAANLTSISLTAGDWDVWSNVFFTSGATTNITLLANSLSTTSATLNTNPDSWAAQSFTSAGIVPGSTANNSAGMCMKRINVSSTTTVFLIAFGTFTVSTLAAWGAIQARRIR